MYKGLISSCLSIFLSLAFLTFCAMAIDEEDNLLPNGGFEEIFDKKGVKIDKGGNGAPSAATSWNMWLNGADKGETEVLGKEDCPVDIPEGDYLLHLNVNGATSGLYMYFLNGNGQTSTYSAWVYVLQGKIGLGLGSNANGFDYAKSTKTNEWEYLEITIDGAKIPEEALIYSQDGAADCYIDAAWINFGEESTNPVKDLDFKVDSAGKLPLTWGGVKAENQ